MEKKQFTSQLNLRRVMAEKNIDDVELGRRLGITKQAVSNVVNGAGITVERLHKFADALGVRVRDLFD